LKTGIIADIHGNLEALTKVLDALEREGVGKIVCAGDVVGYGADPQACIALVRERASAMVAGNHDYGAVGKLPLDYFNPAAREAIRWTATQLSEEDQRWLSALPLVHEEEQYQLVHASFSRPGAFGYIFDADEARTSFAEQTNDLAFFGHTHWPSVFLDGEAVKHVIQKVVTLNGTEKVLANAGSVGQPRDANPEASYAVLDVEKGEIVFKRTVYDIDTAAKKILDAGLPASLAERLFLGY